MRRITAKVKDGVKMRCLKNEKGVALVTALLLTLLSLAICMTLLYYITQHMATSAASKRYKTFLEAGHGGVQVFAKDVIPRIFEGYSSSRLVKEFEQINLAVPISNACLKQKLYKNTLDWSSCGPSSTDLEAQSSPDITFHLKGLPAQPGYIINSKIIDTSVGNTDTSNGVGKAGSGKEHLLDPVGVAYNPNAGQINVKHIPFVYRIEVESNSEKNAKEKARLSVLYAY